MSTSITQYQSANLSDDQVIDNFVVRKKEFERVMADIRTTPRGTSFQHYVFVGRRGSGKSTLLRRIQAEVATDDALKREFIVVNLSEEQAGIYKLYDLWDYVSRDLRAQGFALLEIDWQAFGDDLKEYTKVLYKGIHDFLQKEGKRLILLIDNIDRIFKNIGKDGNLLREQLMNFNDVRIIGGSTIMAEDFWRYDLPFYQFFSIKRLEALSIEEFEQLLEHWSKVKGKPEVAEFAKFYMGKIQVVRMLTDGTPRTMQLFVDMLVDRQNERGYEYLRRIIDQATPVYQERLGQLSHQQQKIVVELSFFWEAASIEQLVPVCKMTGKNISAQMSQLVKARIVEKIKGEKKNMYYRLEERFFNLWLLMTQGGSIKLSTVSNLSLHLERFYAANRPLQSSQTDFNFGKGTFVMEASTQDQNADDEPGTEDVARKYGADFFRISKHSSYEFNYPLAHYYENENPESVLREAEAAAIARPNSLEVAITLNIVRLWAGSIPEFGLAIEELVSKILREDQVCIYFLFEQLMIHHQYRLLWDFFHKAEYKNILRDVARPLYYVLLELFDPKHPDLVRIPPELQMVIDDTLVKVRERQKFYYGK